MNHNRGYYRLQRKKHINRKKRIIHDLNDYWHYEHEGELAKGKIHCSCYFCGNKTNNKGKNGNPYCKRKNWKPSDLRKIEAMRNAVEDYENDCATVRHYTSWFPRNIMVNQYSDYDWQYEEELLELLLLNESFD